MDMNGGDVIHCDDLPWIPLGPGFKIRVIRTDQKTGFFTVMIHADAGTVLPRHNHLGAAEIYQMKGSGYHPQTGEFRPGDYVFEHEGAIHDPVHFREESQMLMISYGPSEFLTDDNQPTGRRMDVPMLRALVANARP